MKNPTLLDLLRKNYDNLESLRWYFLKCDPEVKNNLNLAVECIRAATVSYQKLHCSEKTGWGVLFDEEVHHER